MSFEKTFKELDELHVKKHYKEICDLFESTYNREEYRNPDFMWRYSRSLFDLANNTKEKTENNRLVYKALAMVKSGLDLDENNAGCNKWYGILLDLTGRIEGIKKRIENSIEVKKHLDIAKIKSGRSDVMVLHALGVWCYEVSNLGWIERKDAAAYFATPPTSSFEEALDYLLEAEKKSPGFFAPNQLYIGKTYMQLNKVPEAKEFFHKCINYAAADIETMTAKLEAATHLKKLNIS